MRTSPVWSPVQYGTYADERARPFRDLVERVRGEMPGLEFVEPHGAFYFFFRVDGVREGEPVTGSQFCEQLMKQEGVALVPGAAFGDDRWVRLSYAVSDQELERATDRIVRFTKAFASARAA